ncbi:hypothetical protein L1887_20477 [Cichorium endivia]|nr:hypothetical protein L1887_20477 [Cichorium endivia]
MRNNSVERNRRSSVRSYLCGDEFNSVLAEEDSASRRFSNSGFMEDYSDSPRTSKATVFSSGNDDGSEATVTQPISETSNETLHEKTKLNRDERLESVNVRDLEFLVPLGSPSRESIATSMEVQTGNSVVEVKDCIVPINGGSEDSTVKKLHMEGLRLNHRLRFRDRIGNRKTMQMVRIQ